MTTIDVPTWFICTECGDTEKVDNYNPVIPDGWYIQRNEKSWDVYCPCINVPASLPEKDGSGYTAGGAAWNPSTTTTTTWNPGVFSMDLYTYPPLKKNERQEKMDAAFAEMEEEKAEQERRWKKWEETKHSKHMDPTCEKCVEEIERIKRELKDFGKGNKEEK